LKAGKVEKTRAGLIKGGAEGEKRAHLEHEGNSRKGKEKHHAKVEELNRKLERLEEELSKYKVVVDPVDAERKHLAFEAKKKERVMGIARPWTSRQPSAHGCGFDLHECMDRCGDWANDLERTNLFEHAAGAVYDFCPEGKEYCETLFELAEAKLAKADIEGAVKALRKLLEVDLVHDHLGCRHVLLHSLLDLGELGHARALLDNAQVFKTEEDTIALYSRALIEYIAWALLQEEDASEAIASKALSTAARHNPFVSLLIGGAHEAFVGPEDTLPAAEDEADAVENQVLEALHYLQKHVMLWRDADGAPDWLNGVVQESAGLELVVAGIQKVELLGVILEKAAELQEELLGDDDGMEGEEGREGDEDSGGEIGSGDEEEMESDEDDDEEEEGEEEEEEAPALVAAVSKTKSGGTKKR